MSEDIFKLQSLFIKYKIFFNLNICKKVKAYVSYSQHLIFLLTYEWAQ